MEKRLTSKSYEEEVLEQNRRHKGEWLTYESAFYYYKKAKENEMKDYSLSGEKLYLWKELQRKYGVTELEATNILNGRCITDYVEKYQRIKNLVPLKVSKNKSLKENVYGK